jgi:hypothetical protein
MILFPVPAGVPPQEPVNHSAIAPVPAVPPLRERVVLCPLQIVLTPVILVGATDSVFTVTATEAQFVMLQVPLYYTVPIFQTEISTI